MQLIRIIDNEQKPFGKGGLGQKLTYEINGKQKFINVFDSSPVIEQVAALVAGNELEVEIGKDPTGKYDQINTVGPVFNAGQISTTQAVLPPPVQTPYADNQNAQRKSIERQVSLKSAVELVIGSGVKHKTVEDAFAEVIKCAEGFYSYLVEQKVQE